MDARLQETCRTGGWVMLTSFLPVLLIALLAFVALLSFADAAFAQPAPPTVVVSFPQAQNNDAPVAIVLAIMLVLLVFVLARG